MKSMKMVLVGLLLLAFTRVATAQDAQRRTSASVNTAVPRTTPLPGPIRVDRSWMNIGGHYGWYNRGWFPGFGYGYWYPGIGWQIGNLVAGSAFAASARVSEVMAYNQTLAAMGRNSGYTAVPETVAYQPQVGWLNLLPNGKHAACCNVALTFDGQLVVGKDRDGKDASGEALKALTEALKITGWGEETHGRGHYAMAPFVMEGGIESLNEHLQEFLPGGRRQTLPPSPPRVLPQPAPPVVSQEPPAPPVAPTPIQPPPPVPVVNPAVAGYLYSCKPLVQFKKELEADKLTGLDLNARALNLWNTFPGNYTVEAHARDGSMKTCSVPVGEETVFVVPYGVGVYPSVKVEGVKTGNATRVVWLTFDEIEMRPLPSDDGYIIAPKVACGSCK